MQQIFKPHPLFLISLFIIILSSCKTSQLKTESITKNIPTKYIAESENNSSTLLERKKFLFDINLTQLIDSALKNNFDLKATIQKVEIAKANLRQNKGIQLPDLNLNANSGVSKFGDYTLDGIGFPETSTNTDSKKQITNPLPDYFVGFQSSWEIDLWGKLRNKKKSAASKFIASQYEKDLLITHLVSQIATIYFELLTLDKEVDILTDNIELQSAALDLVIAQKEAGKANELAVSMMRAQLLNSKSLLVEVEQSIIEYESQLNFLCGTYPKAIQRNTSYFSQHILTTINVGVPSDLLKNRPDIKQAEYELISANADIKSAKAAFFPSINISGLLGLQSFNALLLLETPNSLVYNALGGLAAPLLNRRYLKANLMQSKAEQQQAYINYEKNVINSFKEVYISINNIKNSKTMFDFKKEETNVLKESILTSKELFKAGRANYLEIITAQKNTLQSQLELIDLYKRQNIALVNLYKALGGGWK